MPAESPSCFWIPIYAGISAIRPSIKVISHIYRCACTAPNYLISISGLKSDVTVVFLNSNFV